MQKFLPVTEKEMKERGWDEVDFVYVTGDAYVDHASFGSAIISRLLEQYGYKVGMIPQPDWRKKESIQVFGRPRLGFLVSAGNMDSMVNHYTVSKKHRQKDSYSPGGEMGLRPDRAVMVYSNLIRQSYKDTPIILGGIEASLRRLSHYDYWDDKVRRSVLMDSGADLISYGMGEHSILEIAEALNSGIPVKEITYIPGTVFKTKDLSCVYEPLLLPEFQEVSESKKKYAESFALQYKNTDPFTARTLAESYGTKGYVVQNPPSKPLTQEEMDDIYDLPYVGTYHPMYEEKGGIPALEEIKFSLTSNRGCFGGCSFCALTFHQGRILQTRSHASLIKEAEKMTKDKDFKGYIHDVGGPTADFRLPSCKKQLTKGVCRDRQCLFPTPCKNLTVDHKDYVELLRKLRAVPGVKKVFIRSGVRFDYVVADKDKTFLHELVKYHVSGQLRVAPEHVSDEVLKFMGKPSHNVYREFLKEYEKANGETGKKQYAVPYFMSSHPGCTLKEAVRLAEYVRDLGFTPEQVQDFYPTPSTLSTCMYYTGIHPLTGETVYVPKNPHEKAIQRALMQYKNPANRALVMEGLKKAGRMDLVGYDKKCLIRPERKQGESSFKGTAEKGRITRKKKTIRNVHNKKKKV
ncbi:MAG: YgiQ family radical SAM protein [Eubacteriales bacterium]|nr:YgiQ family radical SAM protein [Eubacteriales bacterium]